MGILLELIIANIRDADGIAAAGSPEDTGGRLKAEGLDQVKLSTLRSIVTNQEYEDAWIDEFRFLAGNREDGPWVFTVPEALVNALASSPESRLKAIAKQWSRTEEIKIDGWSAGDVEALLGELIALAKEAKRLKKTILMRISS